jgi:hypothetical protein
MTATNSATTTTLAPVTPDKKNVEATKYYVFNETGNIMMASTDSSSELIQQSVRDVFAEVAVFFAAMTKAITTTINPAQGQPYSIYNYTALQNVIGGSGLFIQVTEEDVAYTSQSFGVQFSKELIEALLGLATGSGEMAFASAMIASMGQEALNISSEKTQTDSEVANIIFVCEYLLGMPIVSVIVVRADVTQNLSNINAGPCFKTESRSMTWYLHKDTYLFVTPTFIRKYAGDLESVETDPDFINLVDYLKDSILQVPFIAGVYLNNSLAPNGLVADETYSMMGEFFGAQGTLKFIGGTGDITVTAWSAGEIQFTVSGTQATAATIGVFASASSTTPITQTTGEYTIATAG